MTPLPALLLLLTLGARQDAAPPAPPAAPAQAPATVPVSAFAAPLDLGESPPPLRTARHIHLVHVGIEGAERFTERSREETRALAEHLSVLLRAGADFEQLAREHSVVGRASEGAILGTFPPGLLAPPLDAFLFQAEVGDVSGALETEQGFHVLQRVDTLAATRHLLVRGGGDAAREKAQELLERIRAGEDFGELARRHSEDPFSKDRGGLYTIFERGPEDRLLKAAAFRARVGETVGPIETSAGFHLIQRVPVEGHPPELRETTMVRVRAILVSFDSTPLATIAANRTLADAERLARELDRRIRAGEDMAALARAHDDDLGGRARAGDLGWIHRRNPRVAPFLQACFAAEPGELLEPTLTHLGWAVVRRER